MDCKIEIKKRKERGRSGISAIWIDRDVIEDLRALSETTGWTMGNLAELFISEGLANVEVVDAEERKTK
ncbi:hypothetical protein [Peptoniphilus sp. EMRHCC_23]|uniref:hypothetical protein n=1 Tax=Peptoniphilus rachelemmaiella TaxID=2811779 RepID=UPI001C003BC4|nr:hypothetical protein [Peptoniphilus rachelemmaiella]